MDNTFKFFKHGDARNKEPGCRVVSLGDDISVRIYNSDDGIGNDGVAVDIYPTGYPDMVLSRSHVTTKEAQEESGRRPTDPEFEALIEEARTQYTYGSNDDIEIDAHPRTSFGDDGVWVQAWVWVRFPEDETEEE